MVARAFLFASAVSGSRAECVGTSVVSEDGNQHCYPPVPPTREAGAANEGVGSQYISAKTCFQQYCKSDYIRNFLVDSCSKRGFDHCSSLKYHNTYTKNLETNQYTYDFIGDIDYDEKHAKVTPFSTVSWSVPYDNGGSEVDVEHISHKIGKQSSSSWTSEQDFSFEEDISVSWTVGVPLTVQEKTDITTKFTVATKSSQSHTEVINQDYTITDDVHVAKKSCDTYCVFESDENTVVPYTLRGDFKSSGILSDDGAYMCCYLRNGGSSECGWGGHGHSGDAGWWAWNTAGAAAAWATAQGHNQCPHIKQSGKSAHIDLPGKWVGGMKVSHRVHKYEKPTGHCKKCPADGSTSNSNETAAQPPYVV